MIQIFQSHPKFLIWIRFLVGGTINTGFTYGVYLLLGGLFFYQIAYAIAYAVGILFSYWFNSSFVFKTPLRWKSLISYPVVYVVQYFVSALLLGIFIEFIDIPPQVGPLLVLLLMIPLTFFMTRWVLCPR